MNEWYYARQGQQTGPVAAEEIRRLLAAGELSFSDLAWTRGMNEWRPLGELPAFAERREPPLPERSPDPYAPPSFEGPQAPASGVLVEIEPGSEPLGISACLARAWEVTKRDYGNILLIGLVYGALLISVSMSLETIDRLAGYRPPADRSQEWRMVMGEGSFFSRVVAQVIGTFLGMGMMRIALNLVSGQTVSVALMFGEGRKLLRMLIAELLYNLIVVAGLLLLIVPGIYLALRLGMFGFAIVERDMGILEALSFSWRITEKNALNLLGLGVMSFLIVIAGALALLVGLFAAIPVVWLAQAVAYRWLILGSRAARDEAG